ncbi:MAG TPA: peptidoglycan-associated lipoprotein Pal [Candidatus Nitrosotalea sp.]|nr:peptidoglycan-associated lipoprotein Pal [Candidatus Nitrosotalea sp.]
MSWTRGRALLIALTLSTVACQSAPSRVDTAAPMEGTSAVDASTAKSTLDRPDDETLSAMPMPPPPQEFVPAPRLADIYFDFDDHDIRAEDARILDENAAWLLANPTTLVLIEGHTDERGTTEYNVTLGDLRAAAAMGYLASHGVPAARMVAISYGKERPVCTEHNEACWSRNRRAHFLMKPR